METIKSAIKSRVAWLNEMTGNGEDVCGAKGVFYCGEWDSRFFGTGRDGTYVYFVWGGIKKRVIVPSQKDKDCLDELNRFISLGFSSKLHFEMMIERFMTDQKLAEMAYNELGSLVAMTKKTQGKKSLPQSI